jgi:hypothetical protein
MKKIGTRRLKNHSPQYRDRRPNGVKIFGKKRGPVWKLRKKFFLRRYRNFGVRRYDVASRQRRGFIALRDGFRQRRLADLQRLVETREKR